MLHMFAEPERLNVLHKEMVKKMVNKVYGTTFTGVASSVKFLHINHFKFSVFLCCLLKCLQSEPNSRKISQ